MKQVTDPEAPASVYAIDHKAKQVILKGVPPVLNSFDENALEAALRIKDVHGCKVSVISFGRNLSKPILRKTLAAGADELVIVEDSIYNNFDSFTTAYILANTIKKLGDYDIIFTGRQAADTNAGVVGAGIAELLGISCITIARKVELSNRKLRIERVLPYGYEVVEAVLPALITVSNELGELRSTGITELLSAQKKSITTLTSQDLNITSYPDKKMELLNLYIPQKEMRCEIIGGETAEQAGTNLAVKLREGDLI